MVALNPSIDLEWSVDAVRPAEKNNILSERRWAGGKGVNVARWLRFCRIPHHLLCFAGGATGRELLGFLRAEKIRSSPVSIGESTRVNVIVTPGCGPQWRFNPLGPLVSRTEQARLEQKLKSLAARASLVVFSGSLPRGCRPDYYSRLIRIARAAGAGVVLDCDGTAFQHGIRERPWLVKPNQFELEQWARKPLTSRSQIINAARQLATAIRGWVLVSLGEAGAVLLGAKGPVHEAKSPPVKRVVNTVGAGDALLAAALSAVVKHEPPEEWVRRGVRAGSKAVTLRAGTTCR